MKNSGSSLVVTNPETTWRFLTEEEYLSRIIPGCESITRVGDATYEAVVSIGIAAIRGRYRLAVRILDMEFPRKLVLGINGTGPTGFLEMRLAVNLEPSGERGTTLNWESESQVGGLLANFGTRILSGAAGLISSQFFDHLTALAASSPISRAE
ncbi:MAG: carbon monoxide dehydrogenase subunit G [Firmicutes bacterium]|nr:carbon monoxide dehydrogenase subunit G [Bacillota bacterium]